MRGDGEEHAVTRRDVLALALAVVLIASGGIVLATVSLWGVALIVAGLALLAAVVPAALPF